MGKFMRRFMLTAGKYLAMIVNVEGKYYATSQKIGDANGKVDAVGLGEGVKPKYIKWVNNDRFVISFRQSEQLRDIHEKNRRRQGSNFD